MKFLSPFLISFLLLMSLIDATAQVAYFDIKVTPSTTLNPPQMHVKYNFVGLNVPVVYRTCSYEILPQVVDFYDDSITAIGNYNVYALNALNLRDTVGVARLNLCHPSNVATANWLRIPMYANVTNTLQATAPSCNGEISFTLDTLGNTVNHPKRYYLKDQSTGDTINMHGRSYNNICSGKYYLDIFQPNICSGCYAYYYRTTYIDGLTYFPHGPTVSPVITTIGTTAGCNGSVSIQTSGGIPPYTYDFGLTKNFQSANAKNNLCAGIHFVDVADANGDTTRAQFIINYGYSVTNNPNPYSGPVLDTIIMDWSNCSFNYNLPVDSAFIYNQVFVDTNTVILTWNIWQGGALSQYTDSVSFIYQGTNYVSLIVFCGNAKMTLGSFRSRRINDYFNNSISPVGIKKDLNLSTLKIHPNPSINKLHISIGNNKDSKQITIYDLYGKEIINTQSENNTETELDITDLIPGVYFIKVYTNKNLFFSGKFVKE